MDKWDHIPAPQWSDFQSPNSNDSYFDSCHSDTLTEDQNETIKSEKKPLTTLPTNEMDFFGEIDKVKMTPIRIVSTNNKENVKETNYEDFLAKAISEIQLNSLHRSTRKSMRRISTMSDASEKYYTPSDKQLTPSSVTRSLMKQIKMKNTSAKNLQYEFLKVDKEKSEDLEKSTKNSILNTNKSESNNAVNEKFLPSNLITDKFTLKMLNEQSNHNSDKKKASKVLPYQNRRLSLKKLKKPETKSGKKFVSMAEAVTKYQVGTPKRFRTTSTKEEKKNNFLAKSTAKQLTRAVSPALRSKTRIRQTNVINKVQKGTSETDTNKTTSVKTNSVNEALKKAVVKKVERKPPTVPQPFNLTKMKKITNPVKVDDKEKKEIKQLKSTLRGAASLDLSELQKASYISLNDIVKIEHKKLNENKNIDTTIKRVIDGKITRKHHGIGHGSTSNLKNTVPVVLESDGKAITVQEKEVFHFGIKLDQSKMTKTKAAPFSFEKRAKEFQEKKQQKLKQFQEEQEKKQKAGLLAKSIPVVKRSRSTPHLSNKDPLTVKHNTTPQPFSFEQRDKMLLKKKEELLKQAEDAEKKSTRIFHANPVPNFKFVPVKTTNIKIEHKKEPVLNKNRPLKAVHLPMKKQEDKKISPIKTTKFKKTVAKTGLHSDKRAKERQEFDEKMKEKQLVKDEQKQKEIEQRNEEQKKANLLIRKQMEVKARPMPKYKPIEAIKSNKPLTSPQSPAWTRNNQN